MNNRRKRERREKRQTSYQQAAAPRDPVTRRAQPMAQARNKMRVTRGMRELAVKLPGSIELRGSQRPKAERALSQPSPPLGVKRPDQGEAKRSPSRVKSATVRDQPKLAESQPKLKCRPKSNRKSGSGKSRDFVPWNKDC